MKWTCDEMLRGLGRWLRAAGYDTHIAESGDKDRELIQRSREEGRVLLTRDRKMLEIRHASECVYLLGSNALEDWVCDLNRHFQLSWFFQPFSRCLICNSCLQSASLEDAEKVPPESREMTSRVLYCARCEKTYWEGTHVRRMRRKLEYWDSLCR